MTDYPSSAELVRRARRNGRAEGRAEGLEFKMIQVALVFAAGVLTGILVAYGPLRILLEICP